MSKTVEQRFLMCAELYEDAKKLASIGLSDSVSDKEREMYVFTKIHGARPEELI